jgi:hypothetical protein
MSPYTRKALSHLICAPDHVSIYTKGTITLNLYPRPCLHIHERHYHIESVPQTMSPYTRKALSHLIYAPDHVSIYTKGTITLNLYRRPCLHIHERYYHIKSVPLSASTRPVLQQLRTRLRTAPLLETSYGCSSCSVSWKVEWNRFLVIEVELLLQTKRQCEFEIFS